MTITKIEHVYTVEGTEKEVRDFAQEKRAHYNEVNVYPTPYNSTVVCTDCKGIHHTVSDIVKCDMCALAIDKM